MPTPVNFHPDDGDNSNNSQGVGPSNSDEFTNQPISVSGSPALSSSARTVNNSEQPTSSGRFTNIVNYLNANRGYNQQGGGLAGQIYGDMSGKASGIQSGFNQANDQFQSQANQGRVQDNPSLVGQALSNPSQFVNDQAQTAAFNKLRDATYSGPQSFQDASKYAGDADQFKSISDLSTTEPGRFALLQKLYNTPNYTYGQQSLDNLLLQANPDQLGQLDQLKPLSSNLVKNVADTSAADARQISDYTNEANNTRSNVRGQLAGSINDFQNNVVNPKLADAQSGYGKEIQQISNQLANAQLPSSFANAFKIDPGMMIYNVPVQNFLQRLNPQATAQNVLSPDDYARIGALRTLAGGTLDGSASSILSNYTDPSQAQGFFNQPHYGFDTQGFQNAVNDTFNKYSGEYQPINAAFNPQWKALNDYNNLRSQYTDPVHPDPDKSGTWAKMNDIARQLNADNVDNIPNKVQQNLDNLWAQLRALDQKYNIGRHFQLTDQPIESPYKEDVPIRTG